MKRRTKMKELKSIRTKSLFTTVAYAIMAVCLILWRRLDTFDFVKSWIAIGIFAVGTIVVYFLMEVFSSIEKELVEELVSSFEKDAR